MNKQKLIELRCKAWGITEDEYYCNQCSDFSLEDMARAYRRGKNKGARDKAIQIAELKAEIENDRDLPAIAYMQGAEKQKKKDEEELKKWKDEWQEQVQKATDEGYARTLQTIQLTKAKELLNEFVHHYKAKTIYIENMQDLLKQSEQFISEVEK